MRKIMWFVLGFVLVFAWGMAQAAERPKEWPLDWVASGTSSGVIAATPGATGVSCVAIIPIEQGYEKMRLYPPTTVLFGVGNPCAPSGVTKNADPGGTGLTGDSGITYYFGWRPMASWEDINDVIADGAAGVTPFYRSDGGSHLYTVGGVSNIPSASTDVPPAGRMAVVWVSGMSQFQIPVGTGIVFRSN